MDTDDQLAETKWQKRTSLEPMFLIIPFSEMSITLEPFGFLRKCFALLGNYILSHSLTYVFTLGTLAFQQSILSPLRRNGERDFDSDKLKERTLMGS
jgi:hypothetical protein